MKLLYAIVVTFMLGLTACNSDNNDVICDANGCRSTTQNVNTVNTTNGCFINTAGICQSSVAGQVCLMNNARQCVVSTSSNCTSFDQFGNCLSTTNTTTTTTACTFRDRFGNCLPSICRYIDVFGRCIF